MALKTTEVEAKGGPSRHRSLGLSDEQALRIYEVMRLARAVDERMWLINRQGRAPFVISCQGQEGAQVGTAAALRPGHDWVAPYYRDAGVVLWFGMTARDQMLSFFARREDPNSAGRQMPGHFGSFRLHIITGGSPVGTKLPHAAGVALASKQRMEDVVTAAYFGEGASSQGDCHEAMNFAGIHKLAVLFICENNGYAISVPQSHQMAIQNVADRAAGYGFPGVVVDGNDVLACYEVTRQAVERARRGEGPTLIEVKTYRFTAHSSDDDDKRYRKAEEVASWRQKDPIHRYATYLRDAGTLTDAVEEEITERITRQVDEATEYAEQAPDPTPDDLATFVYKEEPPA
ncbi:MAG TPA: thiamine pyrophosphate-dependent dehydrogenase E1 component subunit alpha [Candidatus Dormibacteraeota bacterium]